MPRLDVFSRIFLVGAFLHVTGLFLDRSLVPYSGAVAVVALAGLVWSRPTPDGAGSWARPVLITGLMALAVVLSQPHGSIGLAEVGQPDGDLVPARADRLLVAGFATVACGAIGAGVLGRFPRLFRTPGIPAFVVPVALAVPAIHIAAAPALLSWLDADDPASRASFVFFPALATILLFPAVAVVLTGVGVCTAFSSRNGLGWAGAGMLPLMVLAISVLPAVLDDDRLEPPTTPYREEYALGTVTLSQELVDANYPTVPYAEPVSEGSTLVGEGGTDPDAAGLGVLFLFGLAAVTTTAIPDRAEVL